MNSEAAAQLRAYVDYFRDLGVYDLYQRKAEISVEMREQLRALLQQVRPQADVAGKARPAVQDARPAPASRTAAPAVPARAALSPFEQSKQRTPSVVSPLAASSSAPAVPSHLTAPEMPLVSLNDRITMPQTRVAAADRHAALESIRNNIGDCTRCPLAYGGRRKIVFADGNPNAKLMFVGEGPGADEDASGVPFVGKAGQLLNNMIAAMGVNREEVYIANVVKCRPPGNRTPEPVEANTCSPFLAEQIDVVQPEYIVALGATAATYLLGMKRPLASLRGAWYDVRGAKVGVTYHPAFLLRDPRMKGEAWKDLQRVMAAMGLKGAAKS